MRIICIVIGLLACFTVLHAQYTELDNIGSNPNHHLGILPIFFAKDSAKGSPYLALGWLRGMLELTNHKRLPEQGHGLFFNYDKMNERLFATDGVSKTWFYPHDSISSFYLVDSNTIYCFERVPLISQAHFLLSLVKSEKGYSLYKRLITKFIVADYRDEGYLGTGRRFDRYTDSYEYYIIYPGDSTFKKLNLTVRAIKKALPSESSRLNKFFSQKSGRVDEHTFVLLLQNINDQNGF
ncbi:hypothetical protein [Puia dinghuensis]|uniref:Uncharacterized protein n=1 Tax=Puia dinghuensis TaxID=1792502 RepID=A0A8J2U8N9_9BACT|nr:hypothetical protein [Puia dinghuensis]GGA86598.1 hypothetical protein GCM10011511_07090 [Puia dinghuensis]